MKFYCLSFEWPGCKYFRELQHARDYLWNLYLENCGDEDDETISRHCRELNNNFIDGVGFIYPCELED